MHGYCAHLMEMRKSLWKKDSPTKYQWVKKKETNPVIKIVTNFPNTWFEHT